MDDLEKCPECGAETDVYHHEATFGFDECDFEACSECEWRGEPT